MVIFHTTLKNQIIEKPILFNITQYLVHSAIFKSKNDYKNGAPLIQILVFKKQDENTIEDLNFDVNSYFEKYENFKQKDLIIHHSLCDTFCKEVYVKDSFYQYIVYLNPEKEFEISATLNTSKTELGNEDLEIFKDLVKSISVL